MINIGIRSEREELTIGFIKSLRFFPLGSHQSSGCIVILTELSNSGATASDGPGLDTAMSSDSFQ